MPSNESLAARRSIRLHEYDYASTGGYFVTICTHDRRSLFSNDAYRDIAVRSWTAIPRHFPHADLDEFVVMPNHVHGIILLNRDEDATVGAQHAAPADAGTPITRGVRAGSLGAIVRSYRGAVAKEINVIRSSASPIWQRNYYEHVIRNQRGLERIRQYIYDNPARWAFDRENPAGTEDEIEKAFWSEIS